MFKTKNNKSTKPAFTLIELLIVIAIIGILATLAVVALQNSRKSARDSKRIADVKQMQTALELYFNDNKVYPLTGEINNSIATGGKIYMAVVPSAPTPVDGDCEEENNNYTYTSENGSTYTIELCIGGNVSDLTAGLKMASPSGIISPSPPPQCGEVGYTLLDIDENTYSTVKIGDQCWMQENLRVTKNPAGSSITRYCPENVINNCDIYGGLYTWPTTMNGAVSSAGVPSGVQGICPAGWHIPSDAEWTVLTDYLGGLSISGGKIKGLSICGSHPCWLSPNTGASNSSDFNAWPAGVILPPFNTFHYFGSNASFWSSSENTAVESWRRSFFHTDAATNRYPMDKAHGFSVRCLKD